MKNAAIFIKLSAVSKQLTLTLKIALLSAKLTFLTYRISEVSISTYPGRISSPKFLTFYLWHSKMLLNVNRLMLRLKPAIQH
jgi:hypothetical protein